MEISNVVKFLLYVVGLDICNSSEKVHDYGAYHGPAGDIFTCKIEYAKRKMNLVLQFNGARVYVHNMYTEFLMSEFGGVVRLLNEIWEKTPKSAVTVEYTVDQYWGDTNPRPSDRVLCVKFKVRNHYVLFLTFTGTELEVSAMLSEMLSYKS